MEATTLSKEEWKELEAEIGVLSIENLEIDGYKVSLTLERKTNTKLCYAVWVDGKIKGEYTNEDSEIGRRFYFKKKKFFYPKKYRDKIAKSRKASKEQKERICTPHIYTLPYYNSFRTLKAELLKNNESIKWIRS